MDLYTTIMICSMFHNNAIVNAIIDTDSQRNPMAITVVTQADQTGTAPQMFKTARDASAFAKQQLAAGNHVNIGMMQIPSGWLATLNNEGTSLDDLLYPCKNVVVGTDLLNRAESYCAAQGLEQSSRDQCALSFYKTGDSKKGIDYANNILNYASAHPFSSKRSELKPAAAVDYAAYLSSTYELPVPNFTEHSSKK